MPRSKDEMTGKKQLFGDMHKIIREANKPKKKKKGKK